MDDWGFLLAEGYDSSPGCGQSGAVAGWPKSPGRPSADLTDEEWDRIAPLMPRPGRCGRPREVEFREVINAVRYLVRSGCVWRMLPVHFRPWQTVYGWFRELARRFSRPSTTWRWWSLRQRRGSGD